jgi:hypothetical protein
LTARHRKKAQDVRRSVEKELEEKAQDVRESVEKVVEEKARETKVHVNIGDNILAALEGLSMLATSTQPRSDKHIKDLESARG